MGVIALLDGSTAWSEWRQASCMPDRCFCEAIGTGAVRQPVNSMSSAAFVVVAVLALRPLRAGGVARGLDGASALRFAGAMAVVGSGSAFFHASLTFWGQTADVLGMYLLVTFLLLESVARRTLWSARSRHRLFWGGNAALLAVLVAWPGARRYVFGALVLRLLWSEWNNRHGRDTGTRFRVALGVLALGFTGWILDLTRVLCAPESPWQGHALWHVCGAVSAWYAYRAVTDRNAIPAA